MEKVSILVRTCNRPSLLRKNLQSIRSQTYDQIEVIIVEDGLNTAESLIKDEFSELEIKYVCTGERKGRTYAGNLALSLATGQYINFLDDDDYFFPDHVKTLVNALEKSELKAAYSVAYECVVALDSKTQTYKECSKKVRFRQAFNQTFLAFQNYIPIQAIMFDRELYESLGGFDENLDLLEDWDLWVRYSTKTKFLFIDQITSVYHVPLKKHKRDVELYQAYESVTNKFSQYQIVTNLHDVNKNVEEILTKIKMPKWKRYLKKVRDCIIYGRSREGC